MTTPSTAFSSSFGRLSPLEQIQAFQKDREQDLNELGWAIRHLNEHLPVFGYRQNLDHLNPYRSSLTNVDNEPDDEMLIPDDLRSKLIQSLELCADHVCRHFSTPTIPPKPPIATLENPEDSPKTLAAHPTPTINEAAEELGTWFRDQPWFQGIVVIDGSMSILLKRMLLPDEQATIPAFVSGYRVHFQLCDPEISYEGRP